MARFWVGPYVWSTEPGPACWRAPAGAVAAVDLRSVAQCAAPSTPAGAALFVTPNAADLGSDYALLGQAADPRDVTLGPAVRAAWRSRFGLQGALAGPDLAAVVYQHLTDLSDPTGDDRAMPLVPTHRRVFEVWLNGTKVSNVPFRLAGAEAAPLLDLLKRQYRAARQDSLDGKTPPQHYRKILGDMVRKYGVDYRNFLPGDVPDEEPLRPETSYTENFNGADGIPLGNQLTWTRTLNDFRNLNGNAVVYSGDALNTLARAEHDVSSADHYTQSVCIALGTHTGTYNNQWGSCCRYSSSAETFYVCRLIDFVGFSPTYYTDLLKDVAGSLTSMVNTNWTPGQGDNTGVVKVIANGSSISGSYNGVTLGPTTDTSIASGTRGGIWGYRNQSATDTVAGDSFQVTDLAASNSPRQSTIPPAILCM